jgi:hypothetical protein
MPFVEQNLWRLAVRGRADLRQRRRQRHDDGRCPYEEIAQYGNDAARGERNGSGLGGGTSRMQVEMAAARRRYGWAVGWWRC